MICHVKEAVDDTSWGHTKFEVESIEEIFKIYEKAVESGGNLYFDGIENSNYYKFTTDACKTISTEYRLMFVCNQMIQNGHTELLRNEIITMLPFAAGADDGLLVISEDAPFFKEAQQMIKLSEL